MPAALCAALASCDRGCGGLVERGVREMGGAPSATAVLPRPVVDCPDGLARCEEGTVSVSRLATLPVPCQGLASACSCPWEAVEACPEGCAADGLEVVAPRALAVTQLCAPGRDAGAFAAPPTSSTLPDAGEPLCDEGNRYLCAGGRVVECGSNAVVARCLRGCFAERTSIDDDGVSREAAFAILCSR